MPEPDEYEQAAFQLQIGLKKLIEEGLSDFLVQDILYDATDSEQAHFPPNSRFSMGLVGSLLPDHKVVRGSKSVQTPLWPAMVSSPEELKMLKLSEIKPTNLTLMIGFGTAVFQVRNNLILSRVSTS